MKAQVVKAIFTNLLFVIGVILIIFGFSKSVTTGAKLIIFDNYPLNAYEETRCEYETFNLPSPDRNAPNSEPSAQNSEQTRQRCLEAIERQRQVQLTEDVATSITTLVSGIFLVYIFRRFIFGNHLKS